MTQPLTVTNPFAIHRVVPSRDSDSRLTEFFRYHGIWAPGVRLFRAVGFRSKAALIALTFALPLGVLAYSYFTDKAAAVAFSAKERLGVTYLREAMPVLTALQRQRHLAVQEALQGRAADEMPSVRAELDQALARLAAAERTHGAELSIAKAHAALLQAIKTLAPAKGLGATVEAHNALADAALELFGAATDNSNLTLDPDIDTYYLMDGSLFALPALQESGARLRDMAWARAAGARIDDDFQRLLTTERVLSLQNDRRLSAAVDKVAAIHPGAATSLGVAEFREQLRAFTEITRQADATPDTVARAGRGSLAHLSQVQQRMMTQLDQLLGVRVDGLNRARLITGIVLTAGLLLALYFSLSFQKVLDGGLKEVAYHIDAMRDGDLTTQPRAWGADEPAKLMHTLVSMQQSLRRIVSQVRHASDTIVHATTEIASGAGDLSARTEQSAATLEETASAMEEMSATVRRNEQVVEEAARIAEANARAAHQGGEIIGEVVATMKQINDSSSRIGDIIGTIDGIAFQTNILALNAAVEAARAGEQGRGFAVVASEVRALAQRSSSAAKEITDLITTSVDQVESGVRVVQRAGDTIGELVDTSQRVRQLLSEVSGAAREQSVGISQSAEAMQALDDATQQNAALVEETAAAAGSLQQQANSLVSEVAQFRLPGAA